MSAKPALTEADLVKLLKAKYGETAGNGDAYVVIPQVRNAAGFDARRTIDALVMSLWPSRGLTLTAIECKSSRSDWQRELKKPEKAEGFCQLVDYFYVVTGAKDIVRPGELPETWGLMVPRGNGLHIEVPAPRLRPVTINGGEKADGRGLADLPPGFDRSALAALLRAATKVGAAGPDEIRAAVQAANAQNQQFRQEEREHFEGRVKVLQDMIRDFEQASGVRITDGRWQQPAAKDVGSAVRLVLNGEAELERHMNRLKGMRRTASEMVEMIDAALESQ